MASVQTQNKIRRPGKTKVAIAPVIATLLLAVVSSMPLVGVAFSSQDSARVSSGFPFSYPSQGLILSQERLSKGKFLVASRQLTDPNFAKTVVLLIEYDQKGAMGVVINRPTGVKLSKVFPDLKGVQERTDTIHYGGPVATNQLLLLVRSGSEPEKSRRVLENIYVTSSRKVLKRIIAGSNGGERFRLFAGYAGWTAGQLDMEVSRGGWHILRADAETVFDKSPSEIWPELIRRSSALWVRVRRGVAGL